MGMTGNLSGIRAFFRKAEELKLRGEEDEKVYEKVVYGNMPSGIGHRDDCFCGRGYDIERGEDWRD